MRIAAGLLVASLAVAGLSACRDTAPPPVTTAPTAADSAEQVMEGVGLTLVQQGLKRGDLLADTAYTFDDQTRFLFVKPRVTFNTETGAPNGTMSAERGTYNMRTQVLEGFGNVVITSADGKRLTSPQVRYNQVTNEVSSDTTFEVLSGDRVQRGVGFTADPNLTRWTCKRACGGATTVPLPTQP